MNLEKLYLKNFRGHKEICVNFDKDINVIIGENDIGKSTIMEALEIFFNGSGSTLVKMETDDLNIYSEEKEIEITCQFSQCDEEVVLDSAIKTSLKDEYLLNNNGYLEIKKVWNCSKEKLSASDLKIYLNAYYPEISEKPLINMKITDLKKKLKEIEDEIDDYEEVNKSVSSAIRNRIYEYYVNNGCKFSNRIIDISKEDAKDIWTKISKFMPVFFLFKSDRSNVDSDAEVQNPLKVATRNALKEIEDDLNDIKERVEQAVKKIGDSTIEKLREINEDIASNLETELKTKAWESIFSFELIDGKGIPLNKRGSGVRRLMLLSYFRAEAERLSKESDNNSIIYAIEEPETSQHPKYQRMIIETFLEIANNSNNQIILTTHTPEVAKMVKPEQLIFLKRVNNIVEVVLDEENKIKGIINTLGILPSITSKTILYVEGETDVMFINNISKLSCFKEIVDLESNNIDIVPLRGGNLKAWISKDYFKEINLKEIHLYDSDCKEYVDLVEKMNRDNDGRRWGINTKRFEIENYIPPSLIESMLDISIEDEKKNTWDKQDVPKLLMSKYGQKKNIKEIKIKYILNGSVSKKITEEDLREIGAYDEICEWFLKIKEISNK